MAKNIEVTLTLDTKKFTGGLKRAKGQMKGFGGQANMTKGSIMGLAARFAPLAAGLIAVGAAFKGVSAAVGAAQKIQDIGVVMNNIVGSAEGGAIALQMVRDVAQELPYDFEQIAGATPALATVSKSVKELEENTRLAADIAATTGLSFEDAASQLQRAFSGGAGAADMFREKGVLAMAGFEAGATYSIDATREKLKEFGESVKGAALDLNNTFSGALSQTQDRMFDFKASMGDAILPEFQAFLTGLVAVYDKNKEGVQGFAKAIGDGVVVAFYAFLQTGAVVVDFLTTLYGVFKSVAAFIQDNFGEVIGEVMDFAVKAVFGVVEAFAFLGKHAIGPVMNLAVTAINGAIQAVGFLGKQIGRLVEYTTGSSAMKDFFENIENAAKEASDVGTADMTALFENIENAAHKARTGGIAQVKIALEDIGSASIGTGAQDFIAQLIADMKEAGEISEEVAEQMTKTLEKQVDTATVIIKNGAKELSESQADYATAAEEMMKVFGQATKSLGTDMATALMEGKSVLDSFKGYFKKIVTHLIAEALRLAVIQPLLSAIFGAFGGGKTLAWSGTGAPSIVAAPGLAGGGPVMKNKPYVVGERGPELMVPNSSGSIIPNDQLGGGNTKTVVTYNINAVDARSFKQLVASDPGFIYSVTQAGARRIPR